MSKPDDNSHGHSGYANWTFFSGLAIVFGIMLISAVNGSRLEQLEAAVKALQELRP